MWHVYRDTSPINVCQVICTYTVFVTFEGHILLRRILQLYGR